MDVRVQVDEARRDQPPGDVDDLARGPGRQPRRDGGDQPAPHRHVVAADVAAAHVDHVPTGK
ncbi:hypothetical protein Psuf_078830 [Phytohabitans suffuscus]|uniref:Uncharacterized protein n=1 Tax=Phytohabitans suffuscus TaxID=624315 RepID=A0A6F8YWM8_9ACTN|nr:hypothetical protein [Phytohabitans suffuscus]BCB90570.1 hypothetical protein Psuf_078830 [Phytohabitans suffuscus]